MTHDAPWNDNCPRGPQCSDGHGRQRRTSITSMTSITPNLPSLWTPYWPLLPYRATGGTQSPNTDRQAPQKHPKVADLRTLETGFWRGPRTQYPRWAISRSVQYCVVQAIWPCVNPTHTPSRCPVRAAHGAPMCSSPHMCAPCRRSHAPPAALTAAAPLDTLPGTELPNKRRRGHQRY